MAEKEIGLGQPGRIGVEYVFQGEKGKRDSIIVVAQLSPEFAAAVVDRWQGEDTSPGPGFPKNFFRQFGLIAKPPAIPGKLSEEAGQSAEKLAVSLPVLNAHGAPVEVH